MRSDCALNIILIGMPGAGKSTIGVLLAKRLGYHFVDTDLLIQAREHNRLQEIISEQGMAAFKHLEEEVMCELATSHTVIATGGSAVYSQKAMQHLRRFGKTVFIDVPLEELQRRIEDMDSRGLVIDPDEDFVQLFTRRRPLYQAYADLTVNGAGMNAEALAAAIELNACG
jgi:shikimate kinase